MKNKGAIYALGAGVSWGVSLGIFARAMTALGFSAMQVSAVRTTISAITFVLLALMRERSAFRIRLRDGWIFLCTGVISVTCFCYLYFTSTANCSLAVAGILQYTAPIWVVLFSALLFRERITRVKAVAMTVAITGCVLVSGITKGVDNISVLGIVTGALSGVTYATYTIFTRFAVPKYSTTTINLYTFLVASLSSLVMAGPVRTIAAVCTPEVLPTAIIGGLFCAAVPYYLYTHALELLDNGKASILATVEPVIATAVSVFYFHEPLGLPAFIGILLILGAIILLAVQRGDVPAKTEAEAAE